MNCWFACDITAALLVVKNKSIALLWELNSIFMQILRGKNSIRHLHISHDAPHLHPQILQNHCFHFLLGWL